mmetsp:Transcript_12536/g.50188  ORF Transcript_12536/g.50188 Transcript_12536/m.50188 type:complete len:484 (-) Transcript_12536:149-1600(-)
MFASKAQLIRAEELSLLGLGVGRDGQVLKARAMLHQGEHDRLVWVVDGDNVIRRAIHVHNIEVDVGKEVEALRVLGEVLRAEKPAFLCSDSGEDDGPVELRARHCSGGGEDERTSTGVVNCAVVDRISGAVRGTNAKMVMVAREEDGGVVAGRVDAWQDAQHVGALEGARHERAVQRHFRRVLHRLERPARRHLKPLLQRRATRACHRPGSVLGDPALGGEAGLFEVSQLHVLALTSVAQHRIGVAGGFQRVDEEDRLCAAPPRFLVLVRPAAVVGEGLAQEQVRLLLSGRRVVDEADEDLTRHVHVLEVIPSPVLLCFDTVSDEHKLVGVKLDAGRLHVRGDEVVVHEREGLEICALWVQGEARDNVWCGAEERHGLAEDLHARDLLELGSDVLDGELLAACARAPALEEVRGEELHVGVNGLLGQAKQCLVKANGAGRGAVCRALRRRDGEDVEGGHHEAADDHCKHRHRGQGQQHCTHVA